MVYFLNSLTAVMLGLASLSASGDGVDVQVQDPWVRAAPPNVKVLAAYLEIKNNSKKPRILRKVSSPDFGEVGIHRSVVHDKMAHMEHLKELTIPPQASVVLKPGGLHLMLMDAKKTLKIGDQVPMTLTFKSGEKVEFKATVRSDQMETVEDHEHMNHSGHKNH